MPEFVLPGEALLAGVVTMYPLVVSPVIVLPTG
jgi:hypothetical protein